MFLLISGNVFCQEPAVKPDVKLLPGIWERDFDKKGDQATEYYDRVAEIDHKNQHLYMVITPDRKMSRIYTAVECSNNDCTRTGSIEFDGKGNMIWTFSHGFDVSGGLGSKPKITTAKVSIVELTEESLIISF